MALTEYKKKRSFRKTPEPSGKKKASNGALHFVVQKHAASRLHYDFRLEMQGVLKSWAVPKGPSLNPDDKRLAMMVEDHPYDYKDFEGIIPAGNYGAGTVIVWDEGTYEPYVEVDGDLKKQEKELLKELHKGDLKIILHGQKLKGAYALVHIKGREENAWLLIKKKDKFAKTTDVTKKDKSVQSGMKLEQVAKESTNEWQSNRKSSAKKGTRAKIPTGITPMLATLTDKAFDDDDWLYEIKWDGYRALAFVEKGKVNLLSRNNLSFNQKFRPVADALKELNMDVVLDGEIVSVDKEGKGDFQLLQQYQKTGVGQLVYYIFDIIWLNGKDLTELPLTERKEILQQIIPESDILRYSDHLRGQGTAFYDEAERQGLEGIMAKKADSTYHPGLRTKQWLKVKAHRQQEAIICGFTEPRRSRKYFGALVLGVYEDGKLKYAGHTGTGFTEKLQADLYKKMKPLIVKQHPFDTKPKTNMPCTWIKPKLVCEIKFGEWTQENVMRIPVFLGLREDKTPGEVKREKAVPLTKTGARSAKKTAGAAGKKRVRAVKKKSAGKKSAKPKSGKKAASKTARKAGAKSRSVTKVARKAKGTTQNNAKEKARKGAKAPSNLRAFAPLRENFLDPDAKNQKITVNDKELSFTNLNKIYWPKEKIMKRDLITYYHMVAPYILPYLEDRPQSLNRNPDGISKPGFYQKDVTGKAPDWAVTYPYVSETEGKKRQYFVCTDEASLLYLANLGCIEINPWLSTIHHPDNPDWCVIDLDPGKISFDKVIEAALVVKQVADELGMKSYCKTSGSTGLHIYIPLGAKYSYDQSRQLAELVVTQVHHEIPSFTSLERSPAKRKTRIYLDYLQNRTVQTVAAPYSVRPKPGATVSTPLHWDEVKKGLSIQDFNIFNILDRLKEVGDIWKPVMGAGIDLEKVLSKLSKMVPQD